MTFNTKIASLFLFSFVHVCSTSSTIPFILFAEAFWAPSAVFIPRTTLRVVVGQEASSRTTSTTTTLFLSSSNENTKVRSAIKGCTIERVANSLTIFTISVDGQEADLGKFSAGIYQKVVRDAKKMSFQGFRPGTIPPHLEPTYRAFAMDECAREATLEAMEQNQIRPFDGARQELMIENISFMPPPLKKKKKKSNKKKIAGEEQSENNHQDEDEEEAMPSLLTFSDMKGAIDAGWVPGKNFSFTAKNVKGQQLETDSKSVSDFSSKALLPIAKENAVMDDIDVDKAAATIIKNSSDRFMEQ